VSLTWRATSGRPEHEVNGRRMLDYESAREFVWHLHLRNEVGTPTSECLDMLTTSYEQESRMPSYSSIQVCNEAVNACCR